MDTSTWEIISKIALIGSLVFGILTISSTTIMHVADSKLKKIFRAQDNEMHKKLLNAVDSIPNTVIKQLEEQSEEDKKEDENTFRLLALNKYKKNEYFDALSDINKAIECGNNNPKNYLLRGYIYSAIYDKFGERYYIRQKEDVKQNYTLQWYKEAVSDYSKVIALTEEESSLAIEAKIRLEFHKALKAGKSGENEAIELYNESIKELDKIQKEYPENKNAKTFYNLVKEFKKIHEEVKNMFVIE